MLPRLLQRVGDYCQCPQDLVTRSELAAFLESEFGLDDEDAQLLIAWLIAQGYLEARITRHYQRACAIAVDTEVLRQGQAFVAALT